MNPEQQAQLLNLLSELQDWTAPGPSLVDLQHQVAGRLELAPENLPRIAAHFERRAELCREIAAAFREAAKGEA